ncbi:MAG TPA: hypothetical protein VIY47_10215 [Ignavibacteriaceae bacterium]
MLYIIGIIALILIIYGLILFLKRGNKEFNPKLSLKERRELDKMVEKKAREEEEKEKEKEEKKIEVKIEEKVIQEIPQKIKPIFPSKEINTEISRFATHLDIDNTKLQHSIRNGVQNYISQDFMVALEEFSLATELSPKDTTGFYCRGLTKLKLKNYESAISDFTEAINLKMKEPNAFYYRALAYYNLHDLDNAILNFKGYINLESNSPEAYCDLGICFKEKDKIEEAINNFSLAIQKRPTHGIAYFERGILRHKQNDKESGCADLRKAFGLGYLEADNYLNELCEGIK